MEKKEAERNLAEIRRMLKETEEEVRQIAINGVDYQLLWGFLVLIGLGVNFLFLKMRFFIWIPVEWFFIMAIGWFFSHRLTKREFKRSGVITYIGKAVGIVWFATSVGIVLVILLALITKSFNPELIPVFISILLGIAFFIESFLLSWHLLSFASPLFWIGAIIMAIFPDYSMLIYLGLIILTMILPGIVLKLRHKGDKKRNDRF